MAGICPLFCKFYPFILDLFNYKKGMYMVICDGVASPEGLSVPINEQWVSKFPHNVE